MMSPIMRRFEPGRGGRSLGAPESWNMPLSPPVPKTDMDGRVPSSELDVMGELIEAKSSIFSAADVTIKQRQVVQADPLDAVAGVEA